MSTQVSALIVTGYGTNCEAECEFVVRKAGADSTRIIHFSALQTGETNLTDYNFLVLPGGFLDGDDLGAAQAAAQRWQYAVDNNGNRLLDQLTNFIERGGLIIGICNGFQLLAKLGLLPALDGAYFDRQCSLAQNHSARYEDRWCHLKVNEQSPCVFTKGLTELYVPVRHGEGVFTPKNDEIMRRIVDENLIAVQYVHPDTKEVTQEYPYNPNGSPLGIAGICDTTGRIFGLMPHPEAYNHVTNHPGWTRGEKSALGLAIFENGVKYLRGQRA